MPDVPKVTVETIKGICTEYGFGYDTKDGEHMVDIGGKEVKARFNENGNLAAGRQPFLEKARLKSPEFRTAYPKPERSKSRRKRQPNRNATSRPDLSIGFLDSYSVDELQSAMELIPQLIDRKRELAELATVIEEDEARLLKLRDLAEQIDEAGLEPYDAIAPQADELERKLAERRKAREEIETKPITAAGGEGNSAIPREGS